MYNYITNGTCSKVISFDINEGKVYNINFEGGCPGNLKILSKILNGWDIDEVINTCSGNICGNRNTSCADQLAKALLEVKENNKVTS